MRAGAAERAAACKPSGAVEGATSLAQQGPTVIIRFPTEQAARDWFNSHFAGRAE